MLDFWMPNSDKNKGQFYMIELYAENSFVLLKVATSPNHNPNP